MQSTCTKTGSGTAVLEDDPFSHPEHYFKLKLDLEPRNFSRRKESRFSGPLCRCTFRDAHAHNDSAGSLLSHVENVRVIMYVSLLIVERCITRW
eukprot:4504040-Amphidinium_carterae.1